MSRRLRNVIRFDNRKTDWNSDIGIALEEINAFHNYWSNINSCVRMYGGIIEDNGNGTVRVGAGGGIYKKDASSVEGVPAGECEPMGLNSAQGGKLHFHTWEAGSNVELTNNAYNYIFIVWDHTIDNGDGTYGNTSIVASTNFYMADWENDTSYYAFRDAHPELDIPARRSAMLHAHTVGRVYKMDNEITIRVCGTNAWNFNKRVQLFGEEFFPVIRARGLDIEPVSGELQFNVTEGVMWAEMANRFTVRAFDMEVGDTFTAWYKHSAEEFDLNLSDLQTTYPLGYPDSPYKIVYSTVDERYYRAEEVESSDYWEEILEEDLVPTTVISYADVSTTYPSGIIDPTKWVLTRDTYGTEITAVKEWIIDDSASSGLYYHYNGSAWEEVSGSLSLYPSYEYKYATFNEVGVVNYLDLTTTYPNGVTLTFTDTLAVMWDGDTWITVDSSSYPNTNNIYINFPELGLNESVEPTSIESYAISNIPSGIQREITYNDAGFIFTDTSSGYVHVFHNSTTTVENHWIEDIIGEVNIADVEGSHTDYETGVVLPSAWIAQDTLNNQFYQFNTIWSEIDPILYPNTEYIYRTFDQLGVADSTELASSYESGIQTVISADIASIQFADEDGYWKFYFTYEVPSYEWGEVMDYIESKVTIPTIFTDEAEIETLYPEGYVNNSEGVDYVVLQLQATDAFYRYNPLADEGERWEWFGDKSTVHNYVSVAFIGNIDGMNATYPDGYDEVINVFLQDEDGKYYEYSGVQGESGWLRIHGYVERNGWLRFYKQNEVDPLRYNDTTLNALRDIPSDKYGVAWIYMVHDNTAHVVYGQDAYTSEGAKNAALPSPLPGILAAYSTLVGKMTFQYGGSAFENAESPFLEKFISSGVSLHNDLAGLDGGSSSQNKYYHLDETQYNNVIKLTGNTQDDINKLVKSHMTAEKTDTAYTYDANNMLISYTDEFKTVTGITYDTDNRISGFTETINIGNNSYTSTYTVTYTTRGDEIVTKS